MKNGGWSTLELCKRLGTGSFVGQETALADEMQHRRMQFDQTTVTGTRQTRNNAKALLTKVRTSRRQNNLTGARKLHRY